MLTTPPTIKVVITTFDNLDNLKEQLWVLEGEPVSEIVVVNNGSEDGTREWLDQKCPYECRVVHRDNLGAGPGRNHGLNVAGDFDYVLMLDGGIRPLIGGVQRMVDYLDESAWCDVIGVEIADMVTDKDKAWRRWYRAIGHDQTYRNSRLSHTAYCMARRRAFDGIRFSEEGPFAQPGWGADDDELAYQWNDAGIAVHVVTGVKPYRRASGSFHRLYQETGIWPNQYGSVYEQRVVLLQHKWAKYMPGVQWGEPEDNRRYIVYFSGDVADTAVLIKSIHDTCRQDKLDPPYDYMWKPYSIKVVCSRNDSDFIKWARARELRHHHGDTIVEDGYIVRRSVVNEHTWTGDFTLEVLDGDV